MLVFEKVVFKLEYFNLVVGFKCMFLLDNFVELVKGILKMVLLVGIGWVVVWLLLFDVLWLVISVDCLF